MAPTSSGHRIQYLENASQSLLTTSPAISAHLQMVRNNVADQNEDRRSAQRSSRSCTACGTILVLGWTCEPIRDALLKRTRKDRIAKRIPGLKTIKWTCSRCDAITVFEAAKPERRHTEKVIPTQATTTAFVQPVADKPKVQALLHPESTSKKRARLKRSSLQSMLLNQQKPRSKQPEGFGLDLMDLMKG